MDWGAPALAGLSLALWVYLLGWRGGFWRADQRLADDAAAPEAWPAVVALVPARDEAEGIGRAVASLLAQDYPGRLRVVLADDHSTDDTAAAASRAAQAAGAAERLDLVAARPLPAGWTGKLWALEEARARAGALCPGAAYLWLSDADIEHGPGTLRRLVAKAETERLNLVSLMVALSCRGVWERLLIPPFVYFFQMLYPFPWVNDPERRTAAAAGGCVLLRREALARAGGFAAIKGELIDDCALARRIKDLAPPHGGETRARGIWLGLATGSRSIRAYRGLGGIWRMVARSAYTQLRHSPLRLAGALGGMALAFLAPPLVGLGAALHGGAVAALIGLAAWSLMALSAAPTYRLYRQPAWSAAALPLAALLYGAMTLDSAVRHWRGRGGAWKGRVRPAPREVARKRPDL